MEFDKWFKKRMPKNLRRNTVLEMGLREAFEAGVKTEREACAKICEVSPDAQAWEILGGEEGIELCNALASKIRERSNVKVRGCALLRSPA